MLFTLGLLLLLTPFPSFQSPTNERRDLTGNDATKSNAVFTLSKPKTTAAPAKQTVRPTLKPNTVNQTVSLPPVTTKSKPIPAVIQTTQSAAVKPTPTSGTVTNRDKQTVSANQTVTAKSTSASEVKSTKDKPAQNIQATAPKSALPSGAKTAKNKSTASVNQTAVARSSSNTDVKTSKDKPSPTVSQNVPSKTAKVPTAGGAAANKDKVSPSTNQTTVIKSPTTTKDKSPTTQSVKVVISDGCDSSNTKDQELKLKPGAPLVMTHKISLLPGACSGGCEAEMSALKDRVMRLEREMSSLKEKCEILLYITDN